MGKNRDHLPIRTCISCRKKRAKRELIRLIPNKDGLLVRDEKGTGQGRGGYVCPDKSCWEVLIKIKDLGRVFKKEDSIAVHPELRFETERQSSPYKKKSE